MRIGIVGMGFVGRGMHRLLGEAHDAVYYDKFGPSTATLPEAARQDAVFVCVPTPSRGDGSADVSAVEDVVAHLDPMKLNVIKSTVPPGTCDRLGAKYGRHLHFSPEYMGEGRQFVAPWKYPDPRDARSHEFVICGGERAHEVLSLYATVMSNDARYLATTNTAAELAKYMENAFLATKVAFCYEWASIAATFGVPYADLRELWLQDPRVGRSHTMVLAGQRGFNGKCLPKDLSAIVEASTEAGFDPEILRAVRDVNIARTGDA